MYGDGGYVYIASTCNGSFRSLLNITDCDGFRGVGSVAGTDSQRQSAEVQEEEKTASFLSLRGTTGRRISSTIIRRSRKRARRKKIPLVDSNNGRVETGFLQRDLAEKEDHRLNIHSSTEKKGEFWSPPKIRSKLKKKKSRIQILDSSGCATQVGNLGNVLTDFYIELRRKTAER